MAIDREAALKKAEKFLRQGKLDGAIEEYVRLIEDQPRDWNSINALGDLYVRAGDSDRAVDQFTRIADHLFTEGFFPKAAALYKKALKVNAAHEPTLLRLGDIAARAGLLADAKTYFRQLAEQRRSRGDERGAAECLMRLGALEEADPESRIAGARAAQQVGDAAQAAAMLKAAAKDLEKQNRRAEALDMLVDAAQLDPGDHALRVRLARECVKAGQLDRARLFLTRESAGDDPDLLVALAQVELNAGRDEEAKTILTRLLTVASDRHDAVLQFALELARAGHVERAFGCVEVLADASLLDGQWERAAGALDVFARDVAHVPALMKLVEVCVDAGSDVRLRAAQAQLADAYLREGRGTEARIIAEDLVDHDPASDAHVQRLRAALELLGVAEIDRVISDRLTPREPLPMFNEAVDFLETFDTSVGPDTTALEHPESLGIPEPLEIPEPADEAFVLEALEIDLSGALASMGAAAGPVVRVPTPTPPAGPPQDIESVFEGIRTRVEREQQASGAAEQYDRGLSHLRDGRIEQAIADLQSAARVPTFRFRAATQLGRLHIGNGDLQAGVEWLERAAEAPAPAPDEGFAVLYELADALERLGESARALAILMELDADAGGYRDVRTRIEQLTREQAGSRGA
ncbi:MAG: tetratricopeptide repeat protein [Acidobacteria bacterium]|nr:tetratricopeptide repeat protein [Acidobacteriota bacterium]